MKNALTPQASITRIRLAWRRPAARLVIAFLTISCVIALWHVRFDGNKVPSSTLAVADHRAPRASSPRGDQVSAPRHVSAVAADKESAIAELTRKLDERQRSKEARLRAAMILAEDGTDAAVQVLRETLAMDDPTLAQIIAQALGRCTNSQSIQLLAGLLTSANERVVLAAVRSLSEQGSPEAVLRLGELLSNEARSVNTRAEAAHALGTIAGPEALAVLATAAAQIQEEAIASQIIRSIAGRSFDEIRSFLETFLRAPNVPAELKAEALEGLGQAKGNPSALLLDFAKNTDPDLRASAARALSSLKGPGDAGAEILVWLSDEDNAVVRKRLYHALAHQEAFDLNAVRLLITAEHDAAARIAGLELIARAAQQTSSAELAAFVDEQALPELRATALNGATRDERMASVTALRRLNTPAAVAALREIAAETRDAQIMIATGVRNNSRAEGPSRVQTQ